MLSTGQAKKNNWNMIFPMKNGFRPNIFFIKMFFNNSFLFLRDRERETKSQLWKLKNWCFSVFYNWLKVLYFCFLQPSLDTSYMGRLGKPKTFLMKKTPKHLKTQWQFYMKWKCKLFGVYVGIAYTNILVVRRCLYRVLRYSGTKWCLKNTQFYPKWK